MYHLQTYMHLAGCEISRTPPGLQARPQGSKRKGYFGVFVPTSGFPALIDTLRQLHSFFSEFGTMNIIEPKLAILRVMCCGASILIHTAMLQVAGSVRRFVFLQ